MVCSRDSHSVDVLFVGRVFGQRETKSAEEKLLRKQHHVAVASGAHPVLSGEAKLAQQVGFQRDRRNCDQLVRTLKSASGL